MTDFDIKLERIGALLDRRQAEALVIARRDNFAWLTGGGESSVILNQENGFVYLMVTRKERAAVALRADAGKAEEELLKGIGFTFHTLDWKSAGIESYIGSLLEGRRALSDIPLTGCMCDTAAIYELEYPMTETEIGRYRELGRLTDVIMARTAKCMRQGMTENEIKAEVLHACADYGVEAWYRQLGYGQEWMKHGHGAPVGYMLSDASVLYDDNRYMTSGQAYEWYVTVSGAKSAELVMNTGRRQEILSMTGEWPEKAYRTEGGDIIKLPDIWVR